MIERIAHLADLHIPKSPTRHGEIEKVFETLYKSLKKQKPDIIVIVGDLFHDYIDLQPEATILASGFLNKLSEIAPVRITRGNHDIRKKSLKRKDSIEAVVAAINNPKVIYYNETEFFDDGNITWAVWKHGDKKNTPWTKRKKPTEGNTVIDLFHDPINGCKTPTGFEMNRKTYNNIEHFKGDYSFFGDIHKLQYFSDKTKAYCGSLFAQNFSEGDYEFHGYLMWNITNGKVEEIEIKNNYSFKTITVNPYSDFDDLDIDIDNPTKHMRIRIIWKTLPSTHSVDNKRKIVSYLKENYKPIIITHKNEFIEDDELVVEEEIDINNITEQAVQHDIFSAYLERIGVQTDIIDEIIKLDDEIASRVESEELTNIQWGIVKFSGKNFMSYDEIDVDWRNLNGLFQITGLNAVGKTTIMKLITYILYNETRETEKAMKYGDKRYVNNRLNVDSCEGSVVIDVDGQYFGIKRITTIQRTKGGDIKGAPTTLQYYKLENPDDEMNDDNSLENLIDDERKKTQKTLEKAIGTYKNFMRVVMTTSDSLNDILSGDKAVFIDSILKDSGLDIFDLKLEAFKLYHKALLSVPRVTCNVESSEELLKKLEVEINNINDQIDDIENVKAVEVNNNITKGDEYLESLIKKLYRIDDDIYNLDVDSTKIEINNISGKIDVLKEQRDRLVISIGSLKETYDENRLNELLLKKDEHKGNEYNLKLNIRDREREIIDYESKISMINGDVSRLITKGGELKDDIFKLRNEKNCPTCGQLLDENHQEHINEEIKTVEDEMFTVADDIKIKKDEIPALEKNVEIRKNDITGIETTIENASLEMETILNEIGVITIDKNEVDRRKDLNVEMDKIPILMENHQLQMENLQQKIDMFNQNESQIEENKKINLGIDKSKERLNKLKFEKDSLKDDVYSLNTQRGQHVVTIRETNDLIVTFKKQEREDVILNTYKKCIHRDGIPTQLLKTYAIPKINTELTNLLVDVGFNVWLDDDDLKLKLAYNSRLDAVIDAISASGKERTFASVALKFGLNQINMKSKPTLFLLDEVMGKLTEDSVSEFVGILQAIKERMSKVLIIEHNHEINPDHILDVVLDENDISELTIS